jgi:hypothetical protein
MKGGWAIIFKGKVELKAEGKFRAPCGFNIDFYPIECLFTKFF